MVHSRCHGAGVLGAAIAASLGGCGGSRPVGDVHRTDPMKVASALPVPASFAWAPANEDAACRDGGCGDPYRQVVDFTDETELEAAGWYHGTSDKGVPGFAGGVWIAPAGLPIQWSHGPNGWAKIATRLGGWAATATVEVRPGKASCRPEKRGAGLRISGDLGSLVITLAPDSIEARGATAPLAAGPHEIRIEGRYASVTIAVDGKQVLSTVVENDSSNPSVIAFGQLACTDHETRWDRLAVEANTSPCSDCRPGEHPMIAFIRWSSRIHDIALGPTGDTGHTARAYPRCLAYAAFDRAIRELLVDDLADAGQLDRAAELALLSPLSSPDGVDRAVRTLRNMAERSRHRGRDPVHSDDEGGFRTAGFPALVELALEQLPYDLWLDFTASGMEAMFFAALEIHRHAGPAAVAGLLERLTTVASPGGICAARP